MTGKTKQLHIWAWRSGNGSVCLSDTTPVPRSAEAYHREFEWAKECSWWVPTSSLLTTVCPRGFTKVFGVPAPEPKELIEIKGSRYQLWVWREEGSKQ